MNPPSTGNKKSNKELPTEMATHTLIVI